MKKLTALLLIIICSVILFGCIPDDNVGDGDNLPEIGNGVGYSFNDLTLKTLEGESVNTADYRGKILILNIWGTWCGPCKNELPDFNKVASEHADDVVIIAAHTPDGSENAPEYVEANFPDSKIIFAYDTDDSQAFLAAGGEVYLPQTVIVDRNGVILYADSGLMTYDEIVAIIEGQIK